ncbi:MAG: carboxypeptidase M32 [Firmicutes bacterium]|nr:carboxypeptidase M32 [Bacillota bacterium]
MDTADRIRIFREWNKRLSAYQMAMTMIGLDANAAPPRAGASYRGERRAILAGEYRRLLKDEAMFENLQELEEALKSPETAGIAGEDNRLLRREVELHLRQLRREREVPIDLYMAFERARDKASRDWLRAKKEEDFVTHAPLQQELIDRYKEIIAASEASSLSLYDRMLDRHQPGWTTRQYDLFFDQVRSRIVPLLGSIKDRPAVQDDFLYQFYPANAQRRVMRKICDFIGFTDDWGKMSESEHPVTTTVCQGDIRFTTKYREYGIHQAILSTIHETGHAYFNHQIDPAYEGTALGRSLSAGLHESQSRLLENHIGRTEAFWEQILPMLKEEFPDQLGKIDPKTFTMAVNAVHPSLVRTQADEVTYPLHIMIRYEMEKEFLGGDLRAKDLEEVWNGKYREYLGLVPSKPSEGVLQDMHWPYAYFGYFPTYALGSAFAAQFAYTMEQQMDIPALLKENHFTSITDWLKDHVHHFGGSLEAEEILYQATGRPFDPACYCDYLEKKYGDE